MSLESIVMITGIAVAAYGFVKSPPLFAIAFLATAIIVPMISELTPRQYAEVRGWETLGDDVATSVHQHRSTDGVLRYYDYLTIQSSATRAMRNAHD